MTTLVTACGDPAATPVDASPDAPPVPPTRISVVTDVPAGLVAFRDGDGPWQTGAFEGGRYAIDVHGPYRVAAVCDYGDGTMDMIQAARTPDDAREILWTCQPNVLDQPVTGTMVQAGRLALGFSFQSSLTPSFEFELSSTVGAQELVATSGGPSLSRPDRIALRRLAITGATAIPDAIDTDLEGVALLASPFPVGNLANNESASASVRVITEHLTFGRVYLGPAAEAKIAPSSELAVADNQRVTVSASSDGASRSASRSLRQGDPTSFTMPDPLGAVQFTTTATSISGAWSTLPAHDTVTLFLDASSADGTQFWFHDADVSARFITETGATSATIDTDIPGFKAAWKIDLATQEYTRSMSAAQLVGTESHSSSRAETVNTPPDRRVSADRISKLREKRALLREIGRAP